MEMKFFNFPEGEEFWAGFAQFICAFRCSDGYGDGVESLVGGV